MIKVATIGVGSLGQHHARVYTQLDGVELVGVVDSDIAQAKKIAKKLKCRYFKTAQEVIGLVDAVSVVVPNEAHCEIGSLFLANKVHCLIEKPMTMNIDEANTLIKLSDENSAILQVGHIERFNPAVLAIESMKFEPLFIEAHRLGPYSPRGISTGIVMELMIHDIDIVLQMVKRKVKDVQAVGVPVLSSTDDIANVRLSFEGGCVANLTASRVTTKMERKIRIFSRTGYLSIDFLKKEARVYKLRDGSDPTQAGSLIGLSKMIEIKKLKIKDEEQLKLELNSFINCIKKNESPIVSGRQGRDAVALGLNIQKQLTKHLKEVMN